MIKYKELRERMFMMLEGKLEDLKSKWKEIDSSHDEYSGYKNTHIPITHDENDVPRYDKSNYDEVAKNKLIDHIHTHIPERDTNILDWAIDKYHKGQYKVEDLPDLHKTLSLFNKHKSTFEKGKQRIKNYNSLGELYNAVMPYRENEHEHLSDAEKDNIIKSGSTLIHSSPKVKVYKMHGAEDDGDTEMKRNGREACKILGSSSWCISKKENDANLFGDTKSGYNKPTYVIHLPNEKKITKIGYGIGTNQFHDQSNAKISDGDLQDLIKRNPELSTIKDFQGHKWELTDSNDRIAHWNRNSDPKKLVDIIPQISDHRHLHELSYHNDDNIKTLVAKNDNTHHTTLDSMKDESSRILTRITRNPNTRSDTLDHIAKHTDDDHLHQNIVDHHNVSGDTLHHIASNTEYYNETLHGSILDHPNILSKTVDDYATYGNHSPGYILNHPKISNEKLIEIKHDPSRYKEDRDIATKQLKSRGIDDSHMYNFDNMVKKIKSNDILDNIHLHHELKSSTNVSNETKSYLRQHIHNSRFGDYSGNIALYYDDPKTLHDMRNDPSVQHALTQNKHTSTETLHHIALTNTDAHDTILGHPNVSDETMHHIASTNTNASNLTLFGFKANAPDKTLKVLKNRMDNGEITGSAYDKNTIMKMVRKRGIQ